MDITPQVSASLKIIQSYKGAGFRINGQIYEGAIIVCGDEVRPWPRRQEDNPLEISDALRALVGQVDVVLIGMGRQSACISPAIRSKFRGLGFSVDAMDTPAACRTYNVLTAEGRRVAAALLPIVTV